MKRLFGTDGIRGTTEVADDGDRDLLLTPELALRVGHAAGWVARCELLKQSVQGYVVMGRDPRSSGAVLESAVTAGLLAQGIGVIRVGVIPTPGVALLTRQLHACLGVVISASHNPVTDNGIKFFAASGYKLDDSVEEQIEALVSDLGREFPPVEACQLGSSESGDGLRQSYIAYLLQSWRAVQGDLSGYRVMLECANGAASVVAPEVFRRLGAHVEVISGAPDGLNINESYEYVHPARFAQRVIDAGADLGAAFDGDADRVILVDERGGVVDGDTMMGVLARYMQSMNRLPGDFVVTTNMSNFGLHDSLRQVGVSVVETSVGDKYVMRRMLEDGGTLGGERSGHVLILDGDQTTGDGIYTALALASAMVDAGTTLSELASVVPRYPQFIDSISVPPGKPPLDSVPGVQAVLDVLREMLGEGADVHARYSGTEDKLRLSVRASTSGDEAALAAVARQALLDIGRILAA